MDTQFPSLPLRSSREALAHEGSGGGDDSDENTGNASLLNQYRNNIFAEFPELGHAGKPGSASFESRKAAGKHDDDIMYIYVAIAAIAAVVMIGGIITMIKNRYHQSSDHFDVALVEAAVSEDAMV